MKMVTQLTPLSGYHHGNNPEGHSDHTTPCRSSGRNKIRVEIDGDQDNCIVLSEREIAAYDLKEGAPVPDAVWEQLQADLLHKAIQKSGKLLMSMDYSRQGLADKLVRSGIPTEIANTAAGQMEEAGYINDRRLAAGYIAYHIQERSLLRIRQDLLSKHIPEQIIDEEIRLFETQMIQEQTMQGENPQTTAAGTSGIAAIEQAQIRKLLMKRNFSLTQADYAEIQKTAAFLMRKGYSAENIRAVMKNF